MSRKVKSTQTESRVVVAGHVCVTAVVMGFLLRVIEIDRMVAHS